MSERLIDRLRKKDKNGLFLPAQTSVSYPTGFLPFDYRNGYKVQVLDTSKSSIKTYASIGVMGGTFVTIIGKSGVAKTTWCVQTAYNMIKDYGENAFVIHYDLEQALNYTRIQNITGANPQDLTDRYILRQEKNYLEDIFDSIIAIANEKEADKKAFQYNTGLVDEFNNPITTYVPTVVLIDSIPSLASKDMDEEEMKGQTEAMRMAQKLKQFYKKLLPVIKTYNITVFTINHINSKVEMNAFTKTQPQVMYLKMDESVPGGTAPIYYANTFVKFVSAGKFNTEDNGFDGFMVRAELLKSRSNKAGQSCNMIYNQATGFDPILTLYQYAEDEGLVDGRNPYRYFKGYEDAKFDSRKFRKDFNDNAKVREALMQTVVPRLESMLSYVNENEKGEKESAMDAISSFLKSQDME